MRLPMSRKSILILFLTFQFTILIAQNGEYVPGQILVKLKDETISRLSKTSSGKHSLGIPTMDLIIAKYDLKNVVNLFPNEKKLLSKRTFKTINGIDFQESSLHNIYKLEFDSTENIIQIIEELKKESNTEFAEPNYIYSVIENKPLSPELNEVEMFEWLSENNKYSDKSNILEENSRNAIIPTDPLYAQQWGIPATQIDQVWETNTGDSSQVIAILDTGVDWQHPDLDSKIWRNNDEVAGNGVDDDGNGFIDDIRGWDWINNDNNPTDDNSHGTHVAGIAAAEGNNGVGIAGVNWKAKIMPLKVFQSSGRGDAATITQSINYAKTKGATVINMSFGSYTRSLTMEAALSNAYSTSILVAAAGNDDKKIGPGFFSAPMYPAAVSYVLGVQATQQIVNTGDNLIKEGTYLTDFTNFDQDGAIYSEYSDLRNYEMMVPGSSIISTVPNGNYRVMQGTSMATPLLSGAVALYRKQRPADSQELMWGNLINSINGHFKLNTSISTTPQPKLWIISNTIVDTLDGDKDGNVDANETIELWVVLRNTWGQANNAKVKIRFGEFEDHATATIQRDTATIGSIGPYAKRSNETRPFRIKINPNIHNDRDIVFTVIAWNVGVSDSVRQNITLRAFNGTELKGIMDSTQTLTAGKLWIVNNSFRVGSNGHLIIRPGVKVVFYQNINNLGTIDALGKKDSVISFTGPGAIQGSGKATFEYCDFLSFRNYIGSDWNHTSPLVFRNCTFSDFISNYLITRSVYFLYDCIIQNSRIDFMCFYDAGETAQDIRRTNFENISITYDGWYLTHVFIGAHNNFIGINGDVFKTWNKELIQTSNNNFISVRTNKYFFRTPAGTFWDYPNNYWGTLTSTLIDKKNYDFWDDANLAMFRYEPKLLAPSDSAHGIVWKVLVNGKDAQDEVVDPVGVGKQKIEIYFNRPMDKNYIPQVSFGVREPYTQQVADLDGSWSSDGKIYTVYKKVELYTGDGINRVRVAGARDLEDFEIPVEDIRFEFLIDAAGSASTDFLAIAGIGKVSLEWPSPLGTSTLLGFNIYRFTNLTDTTFTEPTIINSQLVTDSSYVDYAVVPHTKYYYKYKIVNTDFTESEYSKVVNATVLSAAKGDANGDLTVNISDVVTIVNYILNQNPQPFILEAADANSDNAVNVLDVVVTINKILHPSGNIVLGKSNSVAKLELREEKLSLTNDVGVAGLQFKLIGNNIKNARFIPSSALGQFEIANSILGDTANIFLIYNLSGKVIPPGNEIVLGRFENTSTAISIKDVVVSDANGKTILTNIINNGESSIPTEYYLLQNYPNPFNMETRIEFGLPKTSDVEVNIYNILGQRIKTISKKEMSAGRHTINWNGRNEVGNVVSSGVYIYQMKANQFIANKKLMLLK